MNRALAKTPEAEVRQSPTQEPVRRQPRQRTPSRPIPNATSSPSQAPTPPLDQPAASKADPNVAPKDSSDRATTGTPAVLGAPGVASDLSVLQALGAALPALLVPSSVPASATKTLRSSNNYGGTTASLRESSSDGTNHENLTVPASAGGGQSGSRPPAQSSLNQPAQPFGAGSPIPSEGQGCPPRVPPANGDTENLSPGADGVNGSAAELSSTDSNRPTAPVPDGPAPTGSLGLAAAPGLSLAPDRDVGTAKLLPSGTKAAPAVIPANGLPQDLGTSAAQQETSMKKPEKTQKTADLLEQNLPGAGTIAAGHTEPRAAEGHSAGSTGDFEKIAATASMSEADKVNGSQTSAPAAAASATTDDARLRSLERTHDLVAMHALRLTQSGNDTLRVVIEPGSGTRLSLELRLNNGAIEAQGVLNQGDFNFLSSHWPELQQQLEPRGIHLADLQCPTGSAMDQRSSQQTGGQSSEEQPPRSAFAEFAFDGSMKDSPAGRKGRLKTYAGWETWA